jgi:hypothetical protein
MTNTPKPPPNQERRHSVLFKYWRRYEELGYSPVGTHPVGTIINGRERDKSPVLYRWQQFCERQAEPREIRATLELQPRAQVGICGGYEGFVALDVDTEDEFIQGIIKKFMDKYFPDAPLRTGKKSRIGAYMFVWDEKDGEPPWLRFVDGNKNTIFEVLGKGRQIIMPPSMHYSGVAYEMDKSYGGELPPPISELPRLGMRYIKMLVAEISNGGCHIDEAFTSTLKEELPTEAELNVYEKLIPTKKAAATTIEFLKKSAKISTERKRGHDNAVQVWQKCADLGCTPDRITGLMWVYWNPRCVPPWPTYESLEAELAGLLASRRSPIGINSPDRIAAQYGETLSDDEVVRITASGEQVVTGAGKAGKGEEGDPWAGVTFDSDDAIQGVPCLIKNQTHGVMLPKKGLAMLGGQSGSGKTFVFINLAVALTTKGSFFGIPVRERVAVLVLAAEGQEDILGRIRAARQAAGVTGPLPIFWITEVPNLADADENAKLASRIKKMNKASIKRFGIRIGLVVIDTVAASSSMTDENSNAEVSVITKCYRLTSMVTGALVMPIHHFGKNIESGPRGASAWRGNIDLMFSILKEEGQFSLSVTKNRFGSEGPIADFDLHTQRVGTDAEDGSPIETCWVRPLITEEAKIIAEAKVANAASENEIVLRKIVEGGGLLRQTELMQALGWKRRKLEWALKRLANEKLAVNPNRRWAATPKGLGLIKRLNDDQEFRSVKLREEERNRKRD